MKAVTKDNNDWFKVHSFKPVEDPSGKIQRWEMVVALNQRPKGSSQVFYRAFLFGL